MGKYQSSSIGYVKFYHPHRIAEIVLGVPTGKKDGDKAEFVVITPKSHLGKIWLQRGDLLKE